MEIHCAAASLMRRLLQFEGWDRLWHSRQKCPNRPHWKQVLQSLVSLIFRMPTLVYFAELVPELLKVTRFWELRDWLLLWVLPWLLVQFLWFWFQLRGIDFDSCGCWTPIVAIGCW